MSKYLLSIFFKTNLSAFRAAILANDTNRICRILDVERHHIFKKLDNEGNTALLLAIKYASPLTVHVLLEQGANPNQTNFLTFQTPLSLLASKIDENDECHKSKLALEMAANLIHHGAYIDQSSPYMFTDENGKDYTVKETPLMTAVRTKNLQMATLFVKKKANVNYIDKETDYRPIHFSIINGDEAMFDLLENAGALCRSVVTNGENTLLHWFCCNKANDEHISLLKKLINKGCDVNAENNLQYTPLMLATKLNMINTCQGLLNACADIDKVNYEGHRAIDLAKLGSGCFKLLQQAKQINSQSNQNTDRILGKKQILYSRSLSKKTSDSMNGLNIDKNQNQRYSLNTLEIENNLLFNEFNREEIDTKYKHVWQKLLHTKQKIRRNRDASLRRSRDCSLDKTNDFYRKGTTKTVRL